MNTHTDFNVSAVSDNTCFQNKYSFKVNKCKTFFMNQDLKTLFSPLSAGHGVRQGVLQRHVQMFGARRRPRLSGAAGVKGDWNTHTFKL